MSSGAIATLLATVLGLTPSQAPPVRTLTGHVEDSSGGAIVGATITVTCGGAGATVVSDATGRFELRDLPATRCTVVGRSALFAPATLEVDLRTRATGYARLVLPIAGLETEVIVTPARGEQEQAFAIPEAVAVTTREELESRPHQILPQALREETGILVQQTTTAQASPFIRGFSAQRIVYLVDGVRLNTAVFRAGATQYLGWIDPAIVQRIEVVRGPASVQYGSDALGGTINVLTLTPPFSPAGTRISGSAEGVVGSADLSGGLEASLLAQMPAFAVRVGAAARRVQDLRPGRGRDSHAAVTRFLGLPASAIGTRLPGTGFSQAGGHVAASLRAGASGTVNGLYLHEEQFGVNRYDRTLGGDGLYRSEFDPQRLDFGFIRYSRGPAGPLHGLTVTFSLNRQQDDRLEQARPSSRIERERGRVVAYGYQAQGTRAIHERHAVTFGGEVYDEYIASARTFETPGGGAQAVRPEIPDGTRYTSSGVFAQIASDAVPGRLSLRGGARYGRFVFAARPQAAFGVEAERVTTGAVTFHSGAVLKLTGATNATVTVSRGFRAANAFDLGAIGLSGGGFEIAPTRAAALGALVGSNDGADAVGTGRLVRSLGPEAVYAFEAGLKVRTGIFSASITGFHLELVDAIQRRTAIFPRLLVGTSIAGHEIVRQDEAGRAFVGIDPRPIVTRVNVDRAQIDGIEMDAQLRATPEWIAGGYFSLTNGRERGTGAYLRRMPPPIGGLRLKWEPSTRPFWVEGVLTFALPQERLSAGDLADARIGARRSRGSIAAFFTGTASDLGLVRDGVLVATGETLAAVQTRLLGSADAAPLFTSTPGFAVLGARGGWRVGADLELTAIAENLTDRNYRWHGSGVDAPGINVQVKMRYRF